MLWGQDRWLSRIAWGSSSMCSTADAHGVRGHLGVDREVSHNKVSSAWALPFILQPRQCAGVSAVVSRTGGSFL